MKFVLRMAWREVRAARRRSLFFLISIAIGVAGLVGVKGFSASLHSALLSEARTLMAADMQIRMNHNASGQQEYVLEQLRQRGVGVSYIRELVTMAQAPATRETVLVELKAVDPETYPFYGNLALDPPGRPGPDTAYVGAELLDRLKVNVGDELRLGQTTVRIAGTVLTEPDRVTAGFSLGPRVLVSHDVLNAAQLLGPGARVTHRWGLKLPSDADVDAVRAEVTAAFEPDGGRIADFRQANPQVARFLREMTRFLSMVAMVALLVGGLGVANAARVFIQQKMDSIAVLKCLGTPSRAVVSIYVLQMVMLGLAGSLLGVALGYVVQAALPSVVGPFLGLNAELVPSGGPALQGLVLGLATAILFTLLPLTAVRDAKPALVLRRDVDHRRGWTPLQVALLGVAAAGVTAIAAWQAGSLLTGVVFTGGLIAATLVLGAAAWVAVQFVRRLPVPGRLTVLRHGLGNIHRPGSQTTAIVLALGVGVTVVLGVYLVQQNMLREVQASSPEGSPNIFFLGISELDYPDFKEWLPKQEGVLAVTDITPVARGQIAALNGVPADQVQLDGDGRSMTRWSFSITWSEDLPPGNEIRQGRWWTPADYAEGQVLASVQQEAAERLKLRIGSTVTMDVDGQQVTMTVFNIRETVELRQGSGFNFVLSPGALDDVTVTYVGMARVSPEGVAAVQRNAVERFPGVTVINLGDVLATVQSVLDRIGIVIRFMAGFAVVAGLIILAGSIASTKFRRTREAALLKTLGATRGAVLRIFAVEYLSIGLVAGAVGAVLASVAAWLVMSYGLEVPFRFYAAPLLAGMGATALLTVVTGMVFTWDVLAARPLEVLRSE